MNSKYYVSNKIFFQDTDIDKVWEFLIPFIENRTNNAEIILVEWLSTPEFELDKSAFKSNDFKGVEPFKVSITQSPFFEKTNDMFLCKHFKINNSNLAVMATDWLKELKETFLCPTFAIKENGKYIFMLSYEGIIACLLPLELDIFNKHGLEFKEWNIKLNDVVIY